jgi:hypothetical protein
VEIKVLGPGCANCRATIALLQQVASARGRWGVKEWVNNHLQRTPLFALS